MQVSVSALLLVILVQHDQSATVLQGPDIIGVFEGRTVVGAYADGLAFRETYEIGGAIAYWDPRGEAHGQWSVVNNLLCTFYDDLAGACFRIEQASANCFDYFAAAESEEKARAPDQIPRYTARGAVTARAPTCPDELQA